MMKDENVSLTEVMLTKFRRAREIKYSNDYLNLNRLYSAILNNFKDILLQLEVYEPLDIVEAFNYAKKRGIFSMEHIYKEKNVTNDYVIHNTLGLMSSTIIEGYGCCRNISAFLADVLKKFDVISKQVLVKGVYDKNMLSDEHLIAYERYKAPLNQVQAKCPFLIPNHVINYIRSNKDSYFVDPSNECIIIPNGRKLISFHSGLEANFIQEIVYVCNIMYKYASILDILKYNMVRSNITNNDYFLIQERMSELCYKNQDLFESLYETNKPLYDEYVCSLEKIKVLINS